MPGDDNVRLVPVRDAPPGARCWHARIDVEADPLPSREAVLSAAERLRAARFGTPSLRARYVAGRATLRAALSEVLGVAPADVPIVRGDRGRPRLEGISPLDFNVSHTRGIAVIAVVERGRVGVDVECLDRRVNADGLARRVCTPRERDALARLDADARRRHFLRTWTCKEAMSKATGEGIAAPFRRIDVDADLPRLLEGPPPYEPRAWTLHALGTQEGYVATLAWWSGPPTGGRA